MAVKERNAASRSVAGAFCGARGTNCSVWERWRSVLWAQKQQLQRLGALLERSVTPEAAVAAPRSMAETFQSSKSTNCSFWGVARAMCGSR